MCFTNAYTRKCNLFENSCYAGINFNSQVRQLDIPKLRGENQAICIASPVTLFTIEMKLLPFAYNVDIPRSRKQISHGI